MPRCLISFGANLGNARATIEQAHELLQRELSATPLTFRLSRLYNTPPVGGPTGQPPFLNAVAAVETSLSPWEVWQAVRSVEQLLGRERFKRWEARRIDLDILLFDDVRIWTPQLKIPHPRMCMRRFILEPAMELAADWVDPVSRRSIGELAKALRHGQGNLVLCADQAARPDLLLEQVARQAVAAWNVVRRSDAGYALELDVPSRWVAALPSGPLSQLEYPLQIQPQPKLQIFLVEERASSGAQWEDLHRDLASRLDLTSSQTCASWNVSGPRYLLATDNPQWAVHEMVSALEAMDCPVEAMSPEP